MCPAAEELCYLMRYNPPPPLSTDGFNQVQQKKDLKKVEAFLAIQTDGKYLDDIQNIQNWIHNWVSTPCTKSLFF